MENDLSDNQRRNICRVLFLLVCALPTIATVYFAAHRRTPDQWAQLVQAQLGVDTFIGGVETPQPGELVLLDVKLFDERGNTIFESLKTEVHMGESNYIEFKNRIQVTRAGLNHFLKEATERLVRPSVQHKPWSVVFRDIEIVDEPDAGFERRPMHSNGVLVQLGSEINGPNVVLTSDDWGEMKLTRDNRNGELQIAIDTHERFIPCWLAKDWFPILEEMGTSTEFSGAARIDSLGGVKLTGFFTGFDLPAGIPQPATSNEPPLIQVHKLAFEDSKWVNGHAWIRVGDDARELPNLSEETLRLADLYRKVIRTAYQEEYGLIYR